MTKIDQATWQKIVVALLAFATTTLTLGTAVFGWQFGDAQQTAILAEISAVLTLIGVILYGANSTVNSAVDQYIKGAWRMGRGISARGALRTAPGAAEVEPTRQQVERFVERDVAA